MQALRGIFLPGLLVWALAGHGQDRLSLLDLKSGDTLRLDPARVLEVRTDSLWQHGPLAAWDEQQLLVRMKRYRGQHLVDTLMPVLKVDVRELLTCRLKDTETCGRYDERKDHQDEWLNKATCAAVIGGGLLFLFGGDEATSRAGAIIAVGGGIAIYGGGKLLGGRDSRRYKMGKRWKLL